MSRAIKEAAIMSPCIQGNLGRHENERGNLTPPVRGFADPDKRRDIHEVVGRILRASDHVAFILEDAHRDGAEKDKPEGARYITITDTAAGVMVRMLRKGLTDKEEAEHQKRLQRHNEEIDNPS